MQINGIAGRCWAMPGPSGPRVISSGKQHFSIGQQHCRGAADIGGQACRQLERSSRWIIQLRSRSRLRGYAIMSAIQDISDEALRVEEGLPLSSSPPHGSPRKTAGAPASTNWPPAQRSSWAWKNRGGKPWLPPSIACSGRHNVLTWLKVTNTKARRDIHRLCGFLKRLAWLWRSVFQGS